MSKDGRRLREQLVAGVPREVATRMQVLDIYTRVSRLDDDRLRSTDGQEIDCRARVADLGAEVGEVHSDPDRSAWNPKIKRAGWDALMARLESGATDGVVVFDLERFSRQPMEGERLLSAAGNGLRVLDSDAEYDLTSPSGRKAFRDQINAAAYYSDRLSTRTRRGKRLKAANGEVDKRRSFGFMNDGVTILQSEADVIRNCAERLLAGESQDNIIKELNVQVPTVRGAEWGYTTFRQVMLRPRNAGYISHNGEVVATLPGDETILDEVTYRRIVALYEARKPGKQPSGRYVLTGIAVCGICGNGLSGRPVYNSARRMYWCKPSGHMSVDAAHLDLWAAGWSLRTLSDPEQANMIERAEQEWTEQRSTLLAEAASIESDLTEIARRLGNRERGWTLARHDAVCKPLEERLNAIERELNELDTAEPGRYSPVLTPREAEYLWLLSDWDEGGPVERRAIVKMALRGRRIVVGPGRSARFDPERCCVR